MPWFVYIVRCADNTLYTGVTDDVARRLDRHNGLVPGGAKYTRGRRPVRLVYSEPAEDRPAALRREAVLKKLTREEKESLIRRTPKMSQAPGSQPPDVSTLIAALHRAVNPAKKAVFQRFFKTGPGEYAEGDVFIGATVPQVRAVAKGAERLPWDGLERLLSSPIHEERLLALLLLVRRFEKGDEAERCRVYMFYRRHRRHINNWDLIDGSAPTILGGWLEHRDRAVLDGWARSKDLWERRRSILATFHFIRLGQVDDTMRIAEHLLGDREDLIHKAVGWMLREAHKRAPERLEAFIWERRARMPRTMLRYAIERFPETKRRAFMAT
jgi:predicted GIY-YIG superfamily endonuclease/3-methyladenine DNA glycosylase AlkD